MIMSHTVIELKNNNQSIVLLGETHYKNAEEHRLCEIIKSGFTIIGYEHYKGSWLSSITLNIIARLFYPKMKNSSIIDKTSIINHLDIHHQELVNTCLTTADLDIIYRLPNKEVITISKKDVEDYRQKKFSRIDLEKHDIPSVGDNFVPTSLFSPLAVLAVPHMGFWIAIFCLYTAFPFLLHHLQVGSYATRRNLSRFFISGGIIYRRDEVMATELLHQPKSSSPILAIFGKAHLEGVIWHLNNAGFVHQNTYSLNEYVNTHPDE